MSIKEKTSIGAILCYLWKKGQSARVTAKEIDDMEGQETVNQCEAQNWLKRFKEDNTSHEDKQKLGVPFCCGRWGLV